MPTDTAAQLQPTFTEGRRTSHNSEYCHVPAPKGREMAELSVLTSFFSIYQSDESSSLAIRWDKERSKVFLYRSSSQKRH